MQTFEGIYENGVVRFLGPVALPNHTKVQVIADAQALEETPIGCNSPDLYEIMGRSYDTGDTDLAARVDELHP